MQVMGERYLLKITVLQNSKNILETHLKLKLSFIIDTTLLYARNNSRVTQESKT